MFNFQTDSSHLVVIATTATDSIESQGVSMKHIFGYRPSMLIKWRDVPPRSQVTHWGALPIPLGRDSHCLAHVLNPR